MLNRTNRIKVNFTGNLNQGLNVNVNTAMFSILKKRKVPF